jgi:hypothetical protein
LPATGVIDTYRTPAEKRSCRKNFLRNDVVDQWSLIGPGLVVDYVRIRDLLSGDLQMSFGTVRENADRITRRYLVTELHHAFETDGMIDFVFRTDPATADLGECIADRQRVDRTNEA